MGLLRSIRVNVRPCTIRSDSTLPSSPTQPKNSEARNKILRDFKSCDVILHSWLEAASSHNIVAVEFHWMIEFICRMHPSTLILYISRNKSHQKTPMDPDHITATSFIHRLSKKTMIKHDKIKANQQTLEAWSAHSQSALRTSMQSAEAALRSTTWP